MSESENDDGYTPDKDDVVMELRKIADEIESGKLELIDFRVLSESIDLEDDEQEAIRLSYRTVRDEQPGD